MSSFRVLIYLSVISSCFLRGHGFSITLGVARPLFHAHERRDGFLHYSSSYTAYNPLKSSTKDTKGALRTSILGGLWSSTNNAEFVNEIVVQLWENIALAGRSMILSRLEPRFGILPGSLKSLHFSKVNLGTIPCQVSDVVVHPLQDDGTIRFDFDVNWHGECQIQLSADLIGSFGIQKVNLEGRMTILLKPLLPVLPAFKAFHFAFINPPKIDLEFTDGLAQIPNFSFIDSAIRKLLREYLNEMMVLPVRISYNLFDQDEDIISNDTYSFKESYQLPIGIARVSILEGRGFVNKQIGTIQDIPDVYCKVKLGSSPEWRTTTIQNDLAPEWENEVADFILSDTGQAITVQAFNENIDADDELGSCSVTVQDVLASNDDDKTMELELLKDGNETGAFVSLKCDTFPSTTDLSSFQQSQSDSLLCGVLVVLITSARDIPLPREQAQTYVKVTVLGPETKKEFCTGVITDYRFYGADALNPQYDCAFHVPLSANMIEGSGSLTLELVNEDNVLGTTLGSTIVPLSLEAFQNAPDRTITERRTIGNDGATLEFQAILRGVELGDASPPSDLEPMTEEKEESAGSIAVGSTGAVSITVVKGQGFPTKRRWFRRNIVPDVYCRIQMDSSDDVWRTSSVVNASPEWLESRHFEGDNHVVNIDAFDANKQDALLGSATLAVGELIAGGGTTNVELQLEGVGSGAFLSIRCDKIEPRNMAE